MQDLSSDSKKLVCKPNILNTPVEELNTEQIEISDEGKTTRDLIQKCVEIEQMISKVDTSLLNIEEASNLLGKTPQTLRNWEKEGKLIPKRGKNNHRFYTKEQLIPFRKEQMNPPEILIPDIKISKLADIFEKLLNNFGKEDKINLTIQTDTIEKTVRISIESEDGLNCAIKTFKMEN